MKDYKFTFQVGNVSYILTVQSNGFALKNPETGYVVLDASIIVDDKLIELHPGSVKQLRKNNRYAFQVRS